MRIFIIRAIFFFLVVFYTSVLSAQYYGSSRQAYSHPTTTKIERVVRLDGPHWAGPHSGCMMCMGNHLISTHGQSYTSLNKLGWQQWSIVHDNTHNNKIKRSAVKKKRDNENLIFVPTPHDVVDKMLEVAEIQSDDVVYDLGCGDGRIVIAAADKYGVKAVGYEINGDLVKRAKERATKGKFTSFLSAGSVEIRQQDILTVDLSSATVVTLYLFPELNKKLVPQLKKMGKGARIVSHYHKIPGLVENAEFSVLSKDRSRHTIYLYKIHNINYL